MQPTRGLGAMFQWRRVPPVGAVQTGIRARLMPAVGRR
jgi:hypothetical protein